MKKNYLFMPLDLKHGLQFFGGGDNLDLPVRRYQRDYKDALETVFEQSAYFGDFSAGGIEVLDGIKENATAFTVKTSDIPVVITPYDTGANVGFGTGSNNSSRFGPVTEVIYVNTDVPYTNTWRFNEGLDSFTTNIEIDNAVADRLVKQSQVQTKFIDDTTANYINDNAGNTEVLSALTEAGVNALFDELSVYYTDLEVVGNKVAKVSPLLYNAIVSNKLTVREKGSSVNIDTDTVTLFKDFIIERVPTSKLPAGTIALVYVTGLGKTFTGISSARTIQTEDFEGIKLQGAGKFGNWIPNDNKKAVTKVTFTPGP